MVLFILKYRLKKFPGSVVSQIGRQPDALGGTCLQTFEKVRRCQYNIWKKDEYYFFSAAGEIVMTQERDHNRIMQNFKLRQGRQLLAIAVALMLILFLALLHNRPDLFGQLPKNAILALQLIVIAAFIVFSSANWRCPACKKYLGGDVYRIRCRKCGVRLR